MAARKKAEPATTQEPAPEGASAGEQVAETAPAGEAQPMENEQSTQPQEPTPDKDARVAAPKMVKVRLSGLKTERFERPPFAVSVIVPDAEGKAQERKGQPITSGVTLTLRRDEFTTVSADHARWLEKHPLFEFEKV